VFPRAIESKYRYPMSGEIRPRARSRTVVSREDYEAHGRAFYRLAAEHEAAQVEGLDEVLETLSEDFILAEKALSFVADRYLGLIKTELFGM
jgi:hypothetical protein